jgi:ATP-dependent protease ClpP protease subunit
MKTIRYGPLVILILLIFATVAFADVIVTQKEEKKPESICPKTLMKESCMSCHVMSDGKWILKETKSDAHLDYPTGTRIVNYGQPDAYGYFELGSVDYSCSDNIKRFFDYLREKKINKAIIEIISGGGDLFVGWRIKSFMDEWKAEGNIVETRVRAIAASAAFIIFLAGSDGHRIANATSELMMHEVRSWKGGFFYFEQVTPSSAEEEAKVYKHFQDTISSWIATRGNIPKKELDDMLKFKEFWMTGKQAKEHGFADMVIGE